MADQVEEKLDIQVADIHEIFASFQGEGTHVGEPMIFVRFAFCDLQCRYCDTPPPEIPKLLTLEDIIKEIRLLHEKQGPFRYVVLTGGEPLRYDGFLSELLPRLQDEGFFSYLESDGTKPKSLKRVVSRVDLIAMDIKLPSATGMRSFWKEHEAYLEAARGRDLFVKVVVSRTTTHEEISQAARLVARFDRKTPFVIQPATAFGAFVDIPDQKLLFRLTQVAAVHLSDVRVIPQTHKILGVR